MAALQPGGRAEWAFTLVIFAFVTNYQPVCNVIFERSGTRSMNKSYRYELLMRHSNETALNTRRELKHQVMEARKIFGFLDRHFRSLEQTPKGLVRNVKMALTARFTNHLFSALFLIERGLILDAFNFSRSALETTAFYWLVCHDQTAASLYEGEKSLPPVEIRRRLESLGVDVHKIRELYAFESTVAHVGNRYDSLQIQWEKGDQGKLLIGGGRNSNLQRAMLGGLGMAVARFMKFEKDYVVTGVDESEDSPAKT